MRPFYITTPIYYVNDKPHIGHAYTTVAVDVLARFQRLRGRPVRFLTGTDEHGEKIEESAKAKGIEPQAFVDAMSAPFREAFEALDCEFDDYIRTTQPRHEERVKKLWSTIQAKGDIYLGEYEGWYSVADEAFITEKELEELDPVTRSKVRKVSEPSYFFKLSDYEKPLLEFYEQNPDFVRPAGRFNEVKAFVKQGLRDLSVSRTSFSWGVPVPGDDEHVMYVWFDALTNYMSALGGPAEPGESPHYDRFWQGDSQIVHVVGKDILRFHAIFWPAFLLAAGLKPPSQIWAHGWLTINGQKMSKRLGNFIPPGPLVEAFGSDVVRYHLMREVAFGQDGDFSHKNVLLRYAGELANGLGNLLNRMVASIVKKSFAGKVPEPAGEETEEDRALIAKAKESAEKAATCFDEVSPHRALEAVWELVGAANLYVDQTAPWALAKEGQTARLARVSYNVLEALRWLSVMVAPVMPNKAVELRQQLGLPALFPKEGTSEWPSTWGGLEAGTQTQPAQPLFPRIDDKDQEALLAKLVPPAEGEAKPEAASSTAKSKKKSKKKGPPPPPTEIAFEDFAKVELKVGLVRSADPVPKSDRLLKLMIDLGEAEPRQVLAGIREHYEAGGLVGKRVVVVANLAPRKIMGIESQGMVLAASDEGGLSVLGVDRDIAPGTRVS